MKLALIAMALVASGYLCAAQTVSTNDVATDQASQFKLSEPPVPLLILHVDGETIEIDPDINEAVQVESFDPNWIKSVEMISGTDATLYYGQKGRNGVLIIDFKDHYTLPFHRKVKQGDGM